MIKDCFQKKFCKCQLRNPEMCKTDELKCPLIFCAEKIAMQIRPNEKRCDEIVLCDARDGSAGIYCIENKGGKPGGLDVDKICEQLRGGAEIVENHLGEEEKFYFFPVLATKRGISWTLHNKLKRENIRLRDKSEKIKVASKNENWKLPQL